MTRAFASLSVRAKLQIFLVVSLALILGLAVFAATQYVQSSQPQGDILVSALSQERSQAMVGTITNFTNIVKNIVQNSTLDANLSIAYVLLSANPGDAASGKEIEDSFRSTLNINAQLRQLRYVSKTGQVLVAVPVPFKPSDVDETYFKALSGKPLSSDIYIDNLVLNPQPSIKLVSRLEVSGSPIGYLVADFDPTGSADPTLPSIYGALKKVDNGSRPVTAYLVSDAGEVISPFTPEIPGKPPVVVQASVSTVIQQPFSAPRQYISPLSGQAVVGYATRIESLKSTLFTETPLVQLGGSEETTRFVQQLAGITLLGVVLVMAIWYLLVTTIEQPLSSLVKLATGTVRGQSAVEVAPIGQRDEVGSLYNTLVALNRQSEQNIRILEARVQERTRDIEATRDIAQIISSIRDLNVLLRQVVDLILQRFENIYHAQVFLIDRSGEYATLSVSTGEVGEKLLSRGHKLAVGSKSVIGQVTSTGQSVVALDTSTSAVHQTNELLPNTRAELALPLKINENILGALDLQSKKVDAFSEADVRLFQSVADQVAIAITNARLFEESQNRLTEIESLNRQLLGEAWRNYAVGRRRALAAASAGGALTDDWSQLQRRAVETGLVVEEFGPSHVTVAIPISLRGQILGAVEWDIPVAAYNDNTRQLANDLVNRLAITADNTRLFEQSLQAAQRERLVNDIATKLMEQTDVGQILQVAVKEIGQALRVPQTSIRLATDQDGTT